MWCLEIPCDIKCLSNYHLDNENLSGHLFSESKTEGSLLQPAKKFNLVEEEVGKHNNNAE
jgi:hypothetical protein